jgi:hypothetical protein
LNGTSAEDLLQELCGAITACALLIQAMPRPHGRDYPEGSASYSLAREAYEGRVRALYTLREELEGVAKHVADAQAQKRAQALRGV